MKTYKLWFVTVPHLVDFYNQQNQIAAQAAATKASLQTQANIQSAASKADAAAADKRAQQEMQLERFKTLMDQASEARKSDSASGLQYQKDLAADLRARAGKDFKSSQQASEQAFQANLAKFREAGVSEREAKRLASQKRGQDIQLTRLEETAPLREAKTRVAQTQADLAGQPDYMAEALQLRSALEAEKNGNNKAALQKLFDQKIAQALKQQPDNPDVIDAAAPVITAKREALKTSLSTDFANMASKAEDEFLAKRMMQAQQAIASGADRARAQSILDQEFARLGKKAPKI